MTNADEYRDAVELWFELEIQRRGVEPTPDGHLDAVLGTRYQRRRAVEQAYGCFGALLDLAAPICEEVIVTLLIDLAYSAAPDKTIPDLNSLQTQLDKTSLLTRAHRLRRGRWPFTYQERHVQRWLSTPALYLCDRSAFEDRRSSPAYHARRDDLIFEAESRQQIFNPLRGTVRCVYTVFDESEDSNPCYSRALTFEHLLD